MQSTVLTPSALTGMLSEHSGFSFVAQIGDSVVAAIVATGTLRETDSDQEGVASTRDQDGGVRPRGVRLECVAADPSLQEKEEIVCCLLNFLLQILLMDDRVTFLEEGELCHRGLCR